MAFASSDGKKFTNRPPMMAHERSMKRMGGIADKTDPLKQPQGEDMENDGETHHAAIHEHLQAMHAATGHGHSHIEHKPEGHVAHHIDHEGNVSGPEEHGDCPGGMCGGGGEEPEYE